MTLRLLNEIQQSGLYYDSLQQPYLITQCGTGYTLVAGKQCLFRLYVDLYALGTIDSVAVKIQGPMSGSDPGSRRGFFLPRDYLIIEPNFPHGTSVGVILMGELFSRSGIYEITFWIHESQGDRFFYKLTTERMRFYPTKDIRLLVVFQDLSPDNPEYAPRLSWRYDIVRAMNRLGSMYPVRDGVELGLNKNNRRSGIRYQIGAPCEASSFGNTNADYYQCVYGQTRQINSGVGDDIDVTVEYRRGFYEPEFLPPGDPEPGGFAGWGDRPADTRFLDLRRVHVTGGYWPEWQIQSTGSLLAQEVGHHFGLEPPASPHSDGGGHSRDTYVVDPFAFDFLKNKPYVIPPSNVYPGDTMGWAWSFGEDSVLINAYDWEHLRGQLVRLNSTGTDIPDAPPPAGAAAAATMARIDSEPVISTNPDQYEKILIDNKPEERWHLTPRGIVPVNKSEGESRISERVHRILSYLRNEGLDEVHAPIGNKRLTVVKAINYIKPLECYNLPPSST